MVMIDLNEIQTRISFLSKSLADKAAEKWKAQQLAREDKLLLELYQIYKYLVFFPLVAVSTTVMGTAATLLAILVDKKIASVCGIICLLYTSPSPRDRTRSRMPSSA